jgi:hypothetical protein
MKVNKTVVPQAEKLNEKLKITQKSKEIGDQFQKTSKELDSKYHVSDKINNVMKSEPFTFVSGLVSSISTCKGFKIIS